MTAPSPRLRTAWRVGSALAAAAGSAVVTSALVNRTRNRARRKAAAGTADAAPALDPAATPSAPVTAAAPELLVHDPAPAAPPPAPTPPELAAPPKAGLPGSDDLARYIEAADKVERAPAAWGRASELAAQQAAGDTGWTPPAATGPGLGDLRVPSGPPTPAVGTAAAIVADAEPGGSPAWEYGLSGVDTRVPRPPGQEDRRRPRRRNHTGRNDVVAAPTAASAPTSAQAPAPAPTPSPVDDGATTTPAPARPGGDVTPDRRLLLFIGVAMAVALLLGLGVVVLGGGDDGSDRNDTASADQSAAGTATTGAPGSQPTTPVAQLTPAQAFTQAGQRLQAAGTFAYEGTSAATDVSPVRPGPWMGVDLTVQGQVQLSPLRLLERGTAADGTTGETASDGVTIWGRSAASADTLTGQSLQTLYTLPDPTPARVGGLLLPQWLTSATGATDAGRDSAGRRMFRATLPASVLGSIEDDAAPVDATLVLTLAANGDPAHLEVTTASGPPLRLVYDLVRLGQPVAIQLPGQASTGAGSTGSTGSATTTGSSTGQPTTSAPTP
jgi:hypothetical protein